MLLRNDVETIKKELIERLPFFLGLSEVRQAVLINMAYNMGVSGFMEFKKFFMSLERENYGRAAVDMMHSRWADQVRERALMLSDLMRSG